MLRSQISQKNSQSCEFQSTNLSLDLKVIFQFRNEGEVVVDRFCKEKRFWKFLKIRREKMWLCLPWWKPVNEGNFTKAELLRTLGNFQSSSSTRTAASEGINCKINKPNYGKNYVNGFLSFQTKVLKTSSKKVNITTFEDTSNLGFDLTIHDSYFTILVERFTNYILAENTYFTNLMQWTEHKIMVLKPSDKYRIKILFRVIVSSL